MKLIYVAGAYTAKTAWQVSRNIEAARVLGAQVAELGGMPVIPHTMTEHFDGIQDYGFWLAGTAELCRRCDALITVDNWKRSHGAKKECQIMWELNKPVFHELWELSDWLEGGAR